MDLAKGNAPGVRSPTVSAQGWVHYVDVPVLCTETQLQACHRQASSKFLTLYQISQTVSAFSENLIFPDILSKNLKFHNISLQKKRKEIPWHFP